MTGKTRGFGQNSDWDPMTEDYNTSMNDSQYSDEEGSGGMKLIPCRLYVTHIPSDLTEDGLRSAFSKFGTINELFLSRDPLKRFGLVRYETPGEAKYAMTKLNHTPPLNLNIAIAKKYGKDKERTNNKRERGSYRDDASTSSRGRNSYRNHNNMTNGNNMEELSIDDDLGIEDAIDPELHLELENLKLAQLKVREEQLQCKHRMLLLKQADKRSSHNSSIHCVLPDGRIVIRNINNERSAESRDGDVSFGAGDSLTIPGLQREWSTACVWCGAQADQYCARCGVAPYCSSGCQQRDWRERHRGVCHNLARLKTGNDVKDSQDRDSVVLPVAAPLRQPHVSNQGVKRDNEFPDTNQVNVKNGQPSRNTRGRGGNNNNNNNNRTQDSRPQPTSNDEDWELSERTNKQQASTSKPPPPQPVQRQEPKPMKKPQEEVKNEPTPVSKDPIPALREPKPVKKEAEVVKKPEVVKKVPEVVKKEPEVKVTRAPATLIDVTPVKKIVPKWCVMDKLQVGDTAVVSVESKASECRTKKAGFVCVSVHEKYEADYQTLCEQYATDCEADAAAYTVTPGEAFSYFNPEDGGWYRARCLTPTLAALLDSGKLVTLQPADKCRRLPSAYEAIPEFCCLLNADSVKIGDSLKCTIKSTNNYSFKVEIENIESGASAGSGDVTRWLPDVEYPVVNVPVAAPSVLIPDVVRPEVSHNSRVLLVDVTSLSRAVVRPASAASQKQFDSILQDVVLFARNAKPLKEPPQKGQTVIAAYVDGLHYRALCKRTNIKQKKYLLEYIEFGNTEVSTLEKLYACPANLDVTSVPAQSSLVVLSSEETALTPPATEYLDHLKDESVDLTLTIPSGAKTAASGSEVILTVVKNNENVNTKVVEMCKPDWKKLEEKGCDVVETEALMHSVLEFVPLPDRGGMLDIVDVSMLPEGSLGAYPANLEHANYVFTTLTERMAEYCNSDIGKEPYLPKAEELCIAQCPPFPQWFRAILLELPSGPGSPDARLCFIDYGNLEVVPVNLIRKMLPEFVTGLPAVASLIEIRDFPKNPTPEMQARALQYMRFNDEGRGMLHVNRCEKQDEGMYIADAPELIAAMLAG